MMGVRHQTVEQATRSAHSRGNQTQLSNVMCPEQRRQLMRTKDGYEKNGPPTDLFRLETPVQAERVIKTEIKGNPG